MLPWKQKEVMLAQSVLGEGWFFHPSLQAECVIFYKSVSGQAQQCTPLIPKLGMLRQED